MNFRVVLARAVRGVFVALIFVIAPALGAQVEPSDLKPVAKEVAKVIAKAKLSSVAVADFVTQNGDAVIEGHYLAQEFSRSLEQSNKRLAVTEPRKVAEVLSSVQLSAKDLADADQLSRISGTLLVEAIITGTVEVSQNSYVVHIAVRNSKDGSVLASRDQAIKRPAYVDALAFLDPSGKIERVTRPGEGGVSVPACTMCSPPHPPVDTPPSKINGSVMMNAVIDSDGRVVRVAVIRSSDSGLAAKAVESVKAWRFKPAVDKNGKPVAVIVPIEVTFNIQ